MFTAKAASSCATFGQLPKKASGPQPEERMTLSLTQSQSRILAQQQAAVVNSPIFGLPSLSQAEPQLTFPQIRATYLYS
jgi:hypothetical protein